MADEDCRAGETRRSPHRGGRAFAGIGTGSGRTRDRAVPTPGTAHGHRGSEGSAGGLSMNSRTGAAQGSRSAAGAATVAARRIVRALGVVRDAAGLRFRRVKHVRVRGSMAPPRRQANRLKEDRPGDRWVRRTAVLWLLLGLGLLGAPGVLTCPRRPVHFEC